MRKVLKLLSLLACWALPSGALGQPRLPVVPGGVQTHALAASELPVDYRPEVAPVYFLLGTLSDYMGRFQYVARQNQVDRYYPYEKPLINYLTNYIAQQLRIKVDTSFEKSGHSRMDSPELANLLNGYYNHRGLLADSLFTTDAQICSFLLGNYYRYGQKLSDKVYKIQLANTLKGPMLGSQLQRAGCDKVLYKFLHNIPTQTIYYFTPSQKLKRYFDLVELENEKLRASFVNSILQQVYKNQQKEAAEMRIAFKKEAEAEAKALEGAFK